MNSDSDHLLHRRVNITIGFKVQHNHHCHPLKPFLYLSCADFDNLVLHDMHKRKCMVIVLNYTHTSENDRVHQSNSHSEATLELQVQVVQEQHLMGVFLV